MSLPPCVKYYKTQVGTVWALCGHCVGIVWALCGHCLFSCILPQPSSAQASGHLIVATRRSVNSSASSILPHLSRGSRTTPRPPSSAAASRSTHSGRASQSLSRRFLIAALVSRSWCASMAPRLCTRRLDRCAALQKLEASAAEQQFRGLSKFGDLRRCLA